MQLWVSNPASGRGGCAFLPVAAALRPPSATLSWRRAGWRRRKLSLARASTDGSGPVAAEAEASTVGDSLEREQGGGGDGVASADSSAGKQPLPVDPKIEKELKKVCLTLTMPK
jgi:hypothetical protein